MYYVFFHRATATWIAQCDMFQCVNGLSTFSGRCRFFIWFSLSYLLSLVTHTTICLVFVLRFSSYALALVCFSHVCFHICVTHRFCYDQLFQLILRYNSSYIKQCECDCAVIHLCWASCYSFFSCVFLNITASPFSPASHWWERDRKGNQNCSA